MKSGWVTALAMACGAGLTAVGLLMNQNAAVMAKAIRVCLECVGIG